MKNISDERPDWSSASESLFRAARSAHEPTPADRARLDAAFARLEVSGSALTPSAAAPGTRGLSLSALAKLSLGVLIIGAGTWLSVRFASVSPAPSTRPSTATAASAHESPPPARVESSGSAKEEPSPRTTANVLQVSERTRDIEPHVRSRKPQARARSENSSESYPKPALSVETPVSAPSQASGTPALPVAQTQPQSIAATSTTVKDVAPTAAVIERAAISPSALDHARDELAFVQRMDAELRAGEFSTALRLSNEHQRRWPQGMFAVEREGMRAIASCGAQSQDANARAERFLAGHPEVPIAVRVKAACWGSGRQSPLGTTSQHTR